MFGSSLPSCCIPRSLGAIWQRSTDGLQDGAKVRVDRLQGIVIMSSRYMLCPPLSLLSTILYLPFPTLAFFPFHSVASLPPRPSSLPLSRYPPVPRSHKIRGRMGTDRVSLPFFMPSSLPPMPFSHRIFAGIFWGTSMENVPISVEVTRPHHRRHPVNDLPGTSHRRR